MDIREGNLTMDELLVPASWIHLGGLDGPHAPAIIQHV